MFPKMDAREKTRKEKFNRWSNSLGTTKSLMSWWKSVRQSAKAMIVIDRRTLYKSGTFKKVHEAKLFKLFNEFVAEKKRSVHGIAPLS